MPRSWEIVSIGSSPCMGSSTTSTMAGDIGTKAWYTLLASNSRIHCQVSCKVAWIGRRCEIRVPYGWASWLNNRLSNYLQIRQTWPNAYFAGRCGLNLRRTRRRYSGSLWLEAWALASYTTWPLYPRSKRTQRHCERRGYLLMWRKRRFFCTAQSMIMEKKIQW